MRARLVLLTALAVTGAAQAHVRLINPSNGAALRWSSPSSVSIVLQADGSEDIDDRSHFAALRGAIRAWNDVSGTTATLVENTSSTQQARTDWESDSIHLMWFDESNASGYFDSGSGIVAITPVWFTSGGTITDADVIFNGADFEFTTSGEPGSFDVQDVAAHELGHLLGFDHSGWAGATLYPYVDTTVFLHRSLSGDDACAVRDAYPQGTHGKINGAIERADESPVAGAYVTARGADGRPFAAALCGSGGVFEIDGLPAGTYTLYAAPLDAPVSSGNLSSGNSIDIDFSSTMLGSVDVASGETVSAGSFVVDGDVTLSLGRSSDDFPKMCVAGETTLLALHGQGLVAGSTLEASDPDLGIAVLSWSGTVVTFSVNVPNGEPPGHVDLTVVNAGGDVSICAAAIEIVPPAPTITGTSVASGTYLGGTALTIEGTGFREGAAVVLGGEIYFDGDPGGATVVDDETIQIVTRATPSGVYDVVVIDPSGVEGRSSNGFTFATNPEIESIFPAIGQAPGGTRVVLRGDHFVAGTVVSIDGVVQDEIEIDSPTRMSFTSVGGIAGGPYVLEIEAPDGSTSQTAFSYAPDPDPSLVALAPERGAPAGGETITLSGANFTSEHDVYFGVDPDTGLGGTLASVTLLDASTLEVVTPAHASGTVSVMVLDPSTGQASVLASGFTFGSSGGGGGGCSVSEVGPPTSFSRDASGLAPLVLAIALLYVRARRSARLEPARHAP